MAIGNAVRFMKDLKRNPDFRGELYSLTNEDVQEHLKKCGYGFSMFELEEAYTSEKIKCQTQEQADVWTELYQMSVLLLSN